MAWLPVFTSLDHLAAFAVASGRGNQPCTYGTLSGAEVLDAVLSALPPGTGLVLDPGAEHVLALPPHMPATDEGADDGA
ncbi:SseB family protein [Saccharopolyspora sp. 7B]|nr:SseB family protein [Saccharopolyspora sp. 7B]MCA1278267.1 SseB family protein [Saccharopolyspora sp. 7B]